MNWYIPNLDPYILYVWQEVIRWSSENVRTALLILYVLRELKLQALKTENVLDDKIISLLIYVFSFKWIKR